MNYSGLILVALSCLTCILAEVTVLKQVQVIYDRSPKLRIRGSGFDVADDHDITLVLGAVNAPPLVVDKDYLVNLDVDGDGIILKLLTNRKWVDLANRSPPVALILSSVKFKGNDANLLPESTIIAQVLATPSIKENTEELYQTASNELRINGTGFVGAKKVDLYFNPPLFKEIAYEDVTHYPITKNELVLRLRHGYKWSEAPGTLSVVGVDTGGGPVKTNGDDGVVVATVKADLDEHHVRVEDTADTQFIYNDEPTIYVKGSGFSEVGNLLRWANGLAGNNVNYTTLTRSESKIVLQLSPGSHWRKNFDNLPGTLTLLAVNTGGGYVAVGPLNAGKGRDVATVFERPAVYTSQTKLFRTHSHEIHLNGTGFPDLNSGFKPLLRFDPELVEGTDYKIIVISRTELELTLVDGKAWRPSPGPLIVTHVNTRGDAAGWIKLAGSGVHIAEVKEDVAAEQTGGVEIFPMGVRVYQSALQQAIDLTGSGFKEGISFTLEPELVANKDYTLQIVNEHQAKLHLKQGKKWHASTGLVVAKSVKIGEKTFKLGGEDGIRIAVVLADPVVTPSTTSYHESQSKLIAIEGTGFTITSDTSITLRPTLSTSFKVLNVMDDQIRLQLQPEKAWLPPSFSLKGSTADTKIPLQVSIIDSGAGPITLDNPVTVGFIVPDLAGVVCDDTCEFAFDGVCDDGSEPKDEYYYQNYADHDDDFGGLNDDTEGRRLEETGGPTGDDEGEGVSYDNGFNDDYYMENEEYKVSACVSGTDCTDCGGVDAVVDYSLPLDPKSGVQPCVNTCMYPRDGVCDDPRGSNYCELGTDCQDCGPVGSDNFTRSDDDGWWDDDDDYWNFDDGNFVEQTGGLEVNRHHVKNRATAQPETPAQMFVVVLEGMVYAVGAIFAAAALYLLHRWYNGQSVPFVQGFNSELSVAEFEMRATQKMPITPDEFRT